jgi:hypothetical protein
MINILNNTNTYSVSSFINNKNVPSNTYSYSNVGTSTYAVDSYSISRSTSNLSPFSSNNLGVVQRDTSNFFNAEGFMMAGLVLGLGGISAGIGAGIGALFGNANIFHLTPRQKKKRY